MIPETAILRVARPTDRLSEITRMYVDGLGFSILAEFHDHEGFDGVIIGHSGQPYHLEFTQHSGTAAGKAPGKDNLLVFYVPDRNAWLGCCSSMRAAGFVETESYNPYWEQSGRTYEDPDGYRVVIENNEWTEPL